MKSPEIKGLDRVNKVLSDLSGNDAETLVKKLASGNIRKVVYVSSHNPDNIRRASRLKRHARPGSQATRRRIHG